MKKEQKEELKELKANGKKKCKHCMSEIDIKAKVCPNCRRKQDTKGCLGHLLSAIMQVVVFIVVIFIIGSIFSSGNSSLNSVNDSAKQMTEQDFKNACQEFTYEDLFRNIDANKGKYVKFTGKIIQVVDDGDKTSSYRIEVTKKDFGFWDDVVYVVLSRDRVKIKFLENDVVTFYGECKGSYSYTSVLGAKIEVPKVAALYMELNKEEK